MASGLSPEGFVQAYSILRNETKRNEIYGVGRKNAYYPKHSLRQH